MKQPAFSPKLTQLEATRLSQQYDAAVDKEAESAGRAIASGRYSRTHLETIFRWKANDRGKSRLECNTDAEIEEALRLAVCAKVPRAAVSVLTGLHGVAVPVASAILTVIRPDAYTILDYRALEALGQTGNDRSLAFYLAYLAYCVDLAEGWNLSLRSLDRALWQWSKNRSNAAPRHSKAQHPIT